MQWKGWKLLILAADIYIKNWSSSSYFYPQAFYNFRCGSAHRDIHVRVNWWKAMGGSERISLDALLKLVVKNMATSISQVGKVVQ